MTRESAKVASDAIVRPIKTTLILRRILANHLDGAFFPHREGVSPPFLATIWSWFCRRSGFFNDRAADVRQNANLLTNDTLNVL